MYARTNMPDLKEKGNKAVAGKSTTAIFKGEMAMLSSFTCNYW